jgi:SAM-dependent methyltransferase
VLDWDDPITDRLVLRTIPGAVDQLVEELREVVDSGTAQVGVERRGADRVHITFSGPLAALRGLRFYSEAAVDLGPATAADAASGPVAERLRDSVDHGALRAVATEPPLTFRVGEVGVGRWALRDQLVDSWGWVNSPRQWQVNLDLVDGSLLATLGDLHLTRRLGRLERLPASTTPVLAAALVRLTKIPAGAIVLDPFCGAGTNLVVAADLAEPGLLLGSDVRREALEAARINSGRIDTARADTGRARIRLMRADAARQPWADASVDRVVANLPFGKRVGTHQVNQALYPAFLRELDRVLAGDGRAVLLTEDKRLFVESVQRTRGLRVIKEAGFATGGAHPTAYVVVRSRGQARRRARRADA